MVWCHYLNQCWNSVNRTLKNKFQWNFNWKSSIFIQEYVFENVGSKFAAIQSRFRGANSFIWPKINILVVQCSLLQSYLLHDRLMLIAIFCLYHYVLHYQVLFCPCAKLMRDDVTMRISLAGCMHKIIPVLFRLEYGNGYRGPLSYYGCFWWDSINNHRINLVHVRPRTGKSRNLICI